MKPDETSLFFINYYNDSFSNNEVLNIQIKSYTYVMGLSDSLTNLEVRIYEFFQRMFVNTDFKNVPNFWFLIEKLWNNFILIERAKTTYYSVYKVIPCPDPDLDDLNEPWAWNDWNTDDFWKVFRHHNLKTRVGHNSKICFAAVCSFKKVFKKTINLVSVG